MASSVTPPPPGVIPYGPPISAADARIIAEAAEAEAIAHGWPVTIAVVDSGGNLVHLHRMDHTQFGSTDIAVAKAKAAVNYKRQTVQFQEALEKGGVNLRMLSVPDITPYDGGSILMRDGAIVGGIGVSGVLAVEDGVVANAGAAALVG
jgi:uncharacterized protein GlcG (DUF336 family)